MSSIQKKVLLAIGAAFLVTTFTVGCGRGTVATVNGRKITRQEYYDRLERLPYRDPNTGQPMEAGALVLQRLINEELILRLAESKNVPPTDQQVNDRLAQASKQPGFSANMKASGVTKDQLKELMRIEQAAFNLQTKDVKVSEADVKKYYDQNKETQFTIPEQVNLAGIFVNSKAEADKAMGLLKSGVDFATVASSLSKDPVSAKQGGRLRPIARGDRNIPEAIQKIIFATPRGKYTNPIPSGGNTYVIFQVLQHRQKRTQSFADVSTPIRERMMVAKGMAKNPALNQDLEKFRESAKVDVGIDRYKKMLVPEKPESKAKEPKK